jgi:hypothetical protein
MGKRKLTREEEQEVEDLLWLKDYVSKAAWGGRPSMKRAMMKAADAIQKTVDEMQGAKS